MSTKGLGDTSEPEYAEEDERGEGEGGARLSFREESKAALALTAMSAAKPLRVALIGGGIGGLGFAIALQAQREEGGAVELIVYEGARQFEEIGAGTSPALSHHSTAERCTLLRNWNG